MVWLLVEHVYSRSVAMWVPLRGNTSGNDYFRSSSASSCPSLLPLPSAPPSCLSLLPLLSASPFCPSILPLPPAPPSPLSPPSSLLLHCCLLPPPFILPPHYNHLLTYIRTYLLLFSSPPSPSPSPSPLPSCTYCTSSCRSYTTEPLLSSACVPSVTA